MSSCLQGQRRDCSLSQSNSQPFRTPIRPLRTESWANQDNSVQAPTQGPPKNIRFASESQAQTIPRKTGSTSTLGHENDQRQWISDLIYLSR